MRQGVTRSEVARGQQVRRSSDGDRGGSQRYRSNRSYRHYNPYRYRYPYRHYSSFSFGYGYYPFYYRYPFYYPYAYSPRGGYYYDHYLSSDAGAIDLNIKPKKAQVYLDGDYIGVVNNFDGFPRYLWLREGTHYLVIYHQGYETLAKRVRVRAGEVIDLKDRMVQGVSRPPEELFAEVGLRADSETPGDSEREDRGRDEDRAWRVRPWHPSEQPGEERPERSPERVREAPAIERDLRGEPGRLSIRVSPRDAVVYLDGRLLGSGLELDRLHAPLLVDAGSHRLEVTRPGYASRTLEFEVDEGEELELEADLERRR